jgi:hypothetical protein
MPERRTDKSKLGFDYLHQLWNRGLRVRLEHGLHLAPGGHKPVGLGISTPTVSWSRSAGSRLNGIVPDETTPHLGSGLKIQEMGRLWPSVPHRRLMRQPRSTGVRCLSR